MRSTTPSSASPTDGVSRQSTYSSTEPDRLVDGGIERADVHGLRAPARHLEHELLSQPLVAFDLVHEQRDQRLLPPRAEMCADVVGGDDRRAGGGAPRA